MQLNPFSKSVSEKPIFTESDILIYHRQVDDKYDIFPFPHNHEGFEIIQTWSDIGYVMINNKIYQMRKGNMYLVDAMHLHWTNPDPTYPYKRSKVLFKKSFIINLLENTNQLFLLEPFFNRARSASYQIVLNESQAEKADLIFHKIYAESLIEDRCKNSMMISNILQLLVFINRSIRDNKSEKLVSCPAQVHIENIMAFINEHYLEEINLDSICSTFHLSKYYMLHLFKQVVGITVMQYLEEKRISEAKKMLIFTNTPITEICFSSGYNNISVFNRSFKRITNISPTQFRKQNRV